MAKQLNVNLAMTADTSKAKMELQALQKQLDNLMMSAQRKDSSLGLSSEIQKATQMAAQLKVQLESATSSTGKLDLTKFNEGLQKSGLKLSDYRAALSSLGPEGSQAFSKLASSIMQAEVPLRRSNALLSNFATTLKNTARWQISSSVLHGFMGALQGAYGYAQDLNESLNNIRIVTGQSIDQMAKFADEANRAAKALSTSTTAYTDAALIYYQQGLNDQAVKERTDVTIKLSNVSRQSAEEVSSQMTAIWNNFDDGSKKLEYYADVITKLGAATAASSSEISDGLQKFASVADTVGLSYEKATAALATVVAETRQSADVVGTAFKTMFARFQGLQLGETLEDGVTLNKYSEAINTVGVNILKANGDLKDMDTILDELGEKWNSIGEAQKVALAETVAGTRQYAQFMAIMNNYDKILANQDLAANSEGTLQEQADIYAESWEAARKRVRAASQAIYQDLLDDKFFIKLLNWLEKTLSFLDKFIDNIGGLKGVLLTLGSVLTSVFSAQIQTSINNMVSSIAMMTPKGQKSAESLRAQANQELMVMANNATSSKINSQQGTAMSETYKNQSVLQQVLLDNAKHMTEEEQKRAQIILDINRKLGEEAIQMGKTADESERNLKNLERSLINEAKRQNTDIVDDKLIDRTRQVQQNIEGMTKSIEIFNRISNGTELILGNVNKSLTQGDQATEKIVSGFKQLAETSLAELKQIDFGKFGPDAETQKRMEELQRVIDLCGTDFSKLSQADLDNLAVEIGLVKDATSETSLSLQDILQTTSTNTLTALFEEIGMSAEQAAEAAKKFIQAAKETAEKSVDASDGVLQLKNSMEAGSEAFKKMGKQSLDFGSVMSTLSSAITSVASAINTLKNLGNIFNNDDLTTGEKILQFMMSIGTILPLITSMTKIQTTANLALAASGAKIQLAFWQVSLIIGAVVAVAAVLIKVFEGIKEKSPEGQLKKLQKTTKDLSDAFDEAQQNAESLKSTIDSYDSVIETLNNCVKGTKEWNDALAEVKQATIDIVQKYPNLVDKMQFEYVNGVRIITNLAEIQKEAQKTANRLQSISLYGNMKLSAQQNLVNDNKLKDKFSNTDNEKYINAAFDNAEYYANMSWDRFAEEFKNILPLSELHDFKDSLKESANNTKQFNSSFSDTSEILANSLLYDTDFQEEAERQGLSDFTNFISKILSEQTADEIDKRYAEISSTINSENKEKVLQEYFDLNGISGTFKGIQNGNFKYYDTIQGKDVEKSVDSVLQSVATDRALSIVENELPKTYNNVLNSIAEKTSQFSSGNKDLLTNLLSGQLSKINVKDFKNMSLTGQDAQIFADLYNYLNGTNIDTNSIEQYIKDQISLGDIYRSQMKDISSLQENIKNLNKAFGSLKFGDIVESLEGLSEHAKSYFQIMEDGTYKLVGSVQGFKDALFKESTVGFEGNLQNYIGLFANQEINEAGTAGARSLGLISSGQAIIGEGEEAHIVNDYETMQANAIAYATATDSLEQLEYVKQRFNEIGIDTETQTLAENAALQDLASKYESCTDDLEAYQHALKSGNDELAAAARETLRYSIAVAELAEKHGFDAKETEAYAKRLKNNLSAAMKEAGFSEKQLEKSALTAAIANQRLDRGLLSLNKNLETYKKSLSSADKNSIEWSNTMEALKTDLADILNMDTSVLTDEFAESLLTDATYSAYLTQALDGNVEAIKKLREIAADNMIINIQTNLSQAGEDVDGFYDKWQSLKDQMAEAMKSGEIDQTDLVKSFNELIEKGRMTKDQIEAALAGMHVAADIETEYNEQEMTVPTTITEEHREISGWVSYKYPAPGNPTKLLESKVPEYRTYTKTIPGEPATVMGYVPTYKIKGTTGSGSSTSKVVTANAPPKKGGKASQVSFIDDQGNTSSPLSVSSTETSAEIVDAFSPLSDKDNGINFIQPSYSSTTTGIKDDEKGGGSEKEATGQAELIEDEEHRYDELNKTLEGLSQQYERLGKARDRAWGKNKIALLEQEMQKLKQMQQTYERYLKTVAGDDWEKLAKTLGSGGNLGSLIAKGQAGGNLQKDYNKIVTSMADAIQYITKDEKGNQQRKTIEWQGLAEMLHMDIILDEFGQIANRDDIEEALETWWNEHVLEWDRHNTDPQWQEEHDTFLQEAEAIREYAEKLLNQYDDSINVFTENYDKWMDNMYEQQAKAYETFRYKVDLKVEISERSLKRIEYAIKVLGDNIYKVPEVMRSWFDKRVTDTKAEVINQGSTWASAYQEAQSLYSSGQISQEDYVQTIKDAQDGLYGCVDALLEINEEMREYYKNVLSKVKDEMSRITNEMDHQLNTVQHLTNVLSLLGRQTDYEAVGKILDAQLQMSRNGYEVSKAQTEMYRRQVAEAEATLQELLADGISEAALEEWKNAVLYPAKEALLEAESEMQADFEAYLEVINSIYENRINQIYQDSERRLSGAWGSFDQVNNALERQHALDDEYLTKTNQIYETNVLIKKLAEDLDKTNNDAAKLRIKNFSAEIEGLQQKNKLSKSELDIAKARYEVLLAEIALEDARNAKSTVRLQRDNEGNYGYVYTADGEQVDAAEDDLAKKNNDLYNLVLGQANDYTQKIIQLTQERNAALKDLDMAWSEGRIADEETYNKLREDINNKYNSLIQEDYESYYRALYWLDQTAVTDHTEAWGTSFQDILDAGEDFKNETDTLMHETGETIDWLNGMRQEATEEAKVGAGELEQQLDDLTKQNDALAKTMIEEVIPASEETLTMAQALTEEWIRQYDEIMALIDAYLQLIDAMNAALNEMAGVNEEEFDPNKDYSLAATQKFLETGVIDNDVIQQLLFRAQKEELNGGHNDKWWTNDQILELMDIASRGDNDTRSADAMAFLQGIAGVNGDQQYYTSDRLAELGITGEDYSLEKFAEKLEENTKAQTDANRLAEEAKAQAESAQEATEESTEKTGENTEQSANTAQSIQDTAATVTEDFQTLANETTGHFDETTQEAENIIQETSNNLINALDQNANVVSAAVQAAAQVIALSISQAAEYAARAEAAAAEAQAAAAESIGGAEGLASGGYTGAWGSSGKLAVLHEKELVLNANDTENILSAISLVRDFASAIDLRAAASNISTGLSSPAYEAGSQTLEQSVTIHAEFPNAINHSEIEEAFNNLVNRASQYANRS